MLEIIGIIFLIGLAVPILFGYLIKRIFPQIQVPAFILGYLYIFIGVYIISFLNTLIQNFMASYLLILFLPLLILNIIYSNRNSEQKTNLLQTSEVLKNKLKNIIQKIIHIDAIQVVFITILLISFFIRYILYVNIFTAYSDAVEYL